VISGISSVNTPKSATKAPAFLYVSKEDRDDENSYSLNYCDPSSGKTIQNIFKNKGQGLTQCVVSSDGKWLYYMDKEETYQVNKVNFLSVLAKKKTDKEVVLKNKDYMGCMCLSPDGKKIYFEIGHTINDTNWQPIIYWANSQGPSDQKTHKLLGGPDHVFRVFTISPNGDHICFLHFKGKNNAFDHEIWLADLIADGKAIINPKRLTVNRLNDMFPKFSPNGKMIYWANIPETGSSKNLEIRYYRRDLNNFKKESVLENISIEKLNSKREFEISADGFFLFAAKSSKSDTLIVVSPNGEELYRTDPKDEMSHYLFLPQN